jgi:hypothetical protein
MKAKHPVLVDFDAVNGTIERSSCPAVILWRNGARYLAAHLVNTRILVEEPRPAWVVNVHFPSSFGQMPEWPANQIVEILSTYVLSSIPSLLFGRDKYAYYWTLTITR